jgi:hypothetical protein
MKLLELFTILELRDRISYAVERYGKQVALRYIDDLENNNRIPHDLSPSLGVDPADYLGPFSDSSSATRKKLITAMRETDAPTIIKYISDFDPSRNKKYLDWIVRQYTSGKLDLEDAYKMESLLDDFDNYKKALKPELEVGLKNPQDLNAWKNYRHLASALRLAKGEGRPAGVKVKNFMKKDEVQSMINHPVPDPVEFFGAERGTRDIDELVASDRDFDTDDWYTSGVYTRRKPEDDKDAVTTEIKPIITGDKIAILQPNTKRASCFLGKGTEWCTGATDSWNAYWEHATEGPLYVILTDKHGKFQWHFETNQFMDVHDDHIPEETLYDIVNEYPVLRKVFADEALEHGKIWLMDPADWTPERVEEYAENHFSHDVLYDMPKAWDGKAPEQTLLAIEKMIREKGDPQHNWMNVRHPTDEDFLAAIQSRDRGIGDYNPVSNILRYAEENGIELSDEVLESAVARDGDAIIRMSPEKIKAHPQWVWAAVHDNPSVLKTSLEMSLRYGDYSANIEQVDKGVGTVILQALENPEGMKAVLNAVQHDPMMVADMGGYFGTEPWMQALGNGGLGQNERDGIINYIDDKSPPLDYVQLLTYLMQQQRIDGHEIHTMEKQMPGGKIPVELQHALVQMNPLWLNYIWEADPSTATLAGKLHDQFEGTKEQLQHNQAEMRAGAVRKAKAIKKAGTE